MSGDDFPADFANKLTDIMGANQEMLDDVLADLFAVMPPEEAAAMRRTLLGIQAEYEADMTKLIEQTRSEHALAEASSNDPDNGGGA